MSLSIDAPEGFINLQETISFPTKEMWDLVLDVKSMAENTSAMYIADEYTVALNYENATKILLRPKEWLDSEVFFLFLFSFSCNRFSMLTFI